MFVVFGSLLTLDGLFADGWAAVAIVASRCSSRGRSRSGSRWPGRGVARRRKAFMAWFGPKGVATMTFSLLVLGRGVPGGERIFNLAALAVFARSSPTA